jgi:GH3 auxin-responsive promoter
MLAANRKAALDMLVAHCREHPQGDLFGGKSFVLGGSTDLVEEAPGIFSGDLSGIVAKTVPWWAKPFYFPRADLALIADWEEKVSVLAEAALKEDIRMISGVPSWMLIFFEAAAKKKGLSRIDLGTLFPKLELIVHGGVNFTPYRERFEALRGSSSVAFREVYPASEGFIGVADGPPAKGLRLTCDHGVFFEFVPVEELSSPHPTRHWVDSIEIGVNYAVVLTTCSGLWSYILGDTVKFLQRNPPRLLVSGRTSYTLSAFGEHLIGEEIEDGVSTAASAINQTVVDYSVGALFSRQEGELGGHLFIVEFDEQESLSHEQQARFLHILDQRLSERNDDYRSHRADGFGMNPPQMLLAPHGSFAAWMKSRGKLGGQHKVPRIITDPDLFQNLKLFIESLHQKRCVLNG